MFTGIVEELGQTISMESSRLSISASTVLHDSRIGDSISVNGACLTISEIENNRLSFDVMPETLRRTNIGDLQPGAPVNLERALTLSARLGGHVMQGHVDGRGTVDSVIPDQDAWIMEVRPPADLLPYIVAKGFIGVDGASLTVAERRTETFTVSLVIYTWEHTTLSKRTVGQSVNLEVDILAKYVEQLVKSVDISAFPLSAVASPQP